jgi:hypothetical protein
MRVSTSCSWRRAWQVQPGQAFNQNVEKPIIEPSVFHNTVLTSLIDNVSGRQRRRGGRAPAP